MKLKNAVIALVLSCAGGLSITGGALAAIGTDAPAQVQRTPSATVSHHDRTTEVNDGTQPGVEGTGEWIDVYEPATPAPATPAPAPVNDGTQPGVEGTGEWIDVYEPATPIPGS